MEKSQNTNKNKKTKEYPRFHPLRILILGSIDGGIFAGTALMGLGGFGIITNEVPGLKLIGIVLGIAFILGFIWGLIKNL